MSVSAFAALGPMYFFSMAFDSLIHRRSPSTVASTVTSPAFLYSSKRIRFSSLSSVMLPVGRSLCNLEYLVSIRLVTQPPNFLIISFLVINSVAIPMASPDVYKRQKYGHPADAAAKTDSNVL